MKELNGFRCREGSATVGGKQAPSSEAPTAEQRELWRWPGALGLHVRARYAWAEPLARISHNQLFFLTLVTCSMNSFCARRHAAGVARICSDAAASARRCTLGV